MTKYEETLHDLAKKMCDEYFKTHHDFKWLSDIDRKKEVDKYYKSYLPTANIALSFSKGVAERAYMTGYGMGKNTGDFGLPLITNVELHLQSEGLMPDSEK